MSRHGGRRDARSRPQLPDTVASYVREMIMSGQLRQGSFLHLERLAAQLKISVTPVREALLALRGEGFVLLEPRKGFTVAPLSRQDVRDTFWVQATLAGELAARTATVISDERLDELGAVQEQLEQASARSAVEEVEAHNFHFHRLINHTAGSRKLAWFLGIAVRYAPRRSYRTITGWQRASVADHRVILNALRARDPDEARRSMSTHIMHAGTLLIDHLEEQGFWKDQT